MLLLGLGGTLLSLLLRDRPEALCADAFVADTAKRRCTLRLTLPHAAKLEAHCGEFSRRGELAFSWSRLSDTRYGCPHGFERELDGDVARCVWRSQLIGSVADCSELAHGAIHYALDLPPPPPPP